MESKIQEKLEKIYNDNLKISVGFVEFRHYRVEVIVFNKFLISFEFTYNAARTVDSNVIAIQDILEDQIIKLFYKDIDKVEEEKHIPYMD